jgi:hypothetical protein
VESVISSLPDEGAIPFGSFLFLVSLAQSGKLISVELVNLLVTEPFEHLAGLSSVLFTSDNDTLSQQATLLRNAGLPYGYYSFKNHRPISIDDDSGAFIYPVNRDFELYVIFRPASEVCVYLDQIRAAYPVLEGYVHAMHHLFPHGHPHTMISSSIECIKRAVCHELGSVDPTRMYHSCGVKTDAFDTQLWGLIAGSVINADVSLTLSSRIQFIECQDVLSSDILPDLFSTGRAPLLRDNMNELNHVERKTIDDIGWYMLVDRNADSQYSELGEIDVHHSTIAPTDWELGESGYQIGLVRHNKHMISEAATCAVTIDAITNASTFALGFDGEFEFDGVLRSETFGKLSFSRVQQQRFFFELLQEGKLDVYAAKIASTITHILDTSDRLKERTASAKFALNALVNAYVGNWRDAGRSDFSVSLLTPLLNQSDVKLASAFIKMYAGSLINRPTDMNRNVPLIFFGAIKNRLEAWFNRLGYAVRNIGLEATNGVRGRVAPWNIPREAEIIVSDIAGVGDVDDAVNLLLEQVEAVTSLPNLQMAMIKTNLVSQDLWRDIRQFATDAGFVCFPIVPGVTKPGSLEHYVVVLRGNDNGVNYDNPVPYNANFYYQMARTSSGWGSVIAQQIHVVNDVSKQLTIRDIDPDDDEITLRWFKPLQTIIEGANFNRSLNAFCGLGGPVKISYLNAPTRTAAVTTHPHSMYIRLRNDNYPVVDLKHGSPPSVPYNVNGFLNRMSGAGVFSLSHRGLAALNTLSFPLDGYEIIGSGRFMYDDILANVMGNAPTVCIDPSISGNYNPSIYLLKELYTNESAIVSREWLRNEGSKNIATFCIDVAVFADKQDTLNLLAVLRDNVSVVTYVNLCVESEATDRFDSTNGLWKSHIEYSEPTAATRVAAPPDASSLSIDDNPMLAAPSEDEDLLANAEELIDNNYRLGARYGKISPLTTDDLATFLESCEGVCDASVSNYSFNGMMMGIASGYYPITQVMNPGTTSHCFPLLTLSALQDETRMAK